MKTQDYAPFRPATLIVPQRTSLLFPAINLAADEWSGASRILQEVPVNNDYYFSIKMPVSTFGVNFVLAIRWTVNDIVHRFKFWEDGVLYYPVYDGERIGLNAIFEVWSLETTGAPFSPNPQVFYTSFMLYPTACRCTNPTQQTILVADDPEELDDFDNPFDPDEGGGGTDPAEPGGGILTVDQLFASGTLVGDYWLFPDSGYGKEADGHTEYPTHISAEEASFWETLLNNEWEVTSFSDRILAWYFYNTPANKRSFDDRKATGSPIPSIDDPLVSFEAPWTLTYLWR